MDFTHGDENCDTVLKKCYRTPRYSLIYAFALGLGIYNSKVLQRMGSNGQWESLGFKVEQGNSKTGDHMIISRPEENTPFYSNDVFDQESIQCKQFRDFEKECEYIHQTIVKAIRNDELLPTDICVICIDSQNIRRYFERISALLRQDDIESFNLLNAPYNNTSFFREGYVTLSTVNKAKGNECGMVIICAADTEGTLLNAGKHFKFGELAARAVREAVAEALFRQTGCCARTQRSVFRRLERFGITENTLSAQCQTQLPGLDIDWSRIFKKIDHDAFLVGAVALYVHLADQCRTGMLTGAEADDWANHLLMQLQRHYQCSMPIPPRADLMEKLSQFFCTLVLTHLQGQQRLPVIT